MLTLLWNPFFADVNACLAHLGGCRIPTVSKRASFSQSRFRIINFILLRIYTLPSFYRHRYSQETFISLYSVLCFYLRSTFLLMYFYLFF